jgi:hypothetical protein
MSMRLEPEGIVVSCDGCGRSLPTDSPEVWEALDALRVAGWSVVLHDSGSLWEQWEHYCPACAARAAP